MQKRLIVLIFSILLIMGFITPLNTMKLELDWINNTSSNSESSSDENEVTPNSLVQSVHSSHTAASQSNVSDIDVSVTDLSVSLFPVKLTGKYSDEGVDTDSNLLINMIKINIEVNSTQALECFIVFSLQWDFGQIQNFPLQIISLKQGVQNISYEFNPREYYNFINNSSFVFQYLSLEYSYGGDGSFLEAYSFYTSREYHYKELDLPEAFFTGKLDILEVDKDGDGLINHLNVSTELNITVTGFFTVAILFTGNESSYSTWESVEKYFEPGMRNVSFSFLLGDLYSHKVNTSYIVKFVNIYYQYYRVHFSSNPTSTRFYYFKEFDPPGAYLTMVFSDQGLDTDADGLFNYLSIIIQLNITIEDSYQISVLLISKEFDNYRKWEENDYEWTKGIHNVIIDFEIIQNYSHSWNDSFIIDKIRIQDSQSQIIIEESFQYTTARYQSSRFDPPIIILMGNYWDQGVDTDQDEKFNLLEIIVEVNVTEEISDYSFLITISDARPVKVSVLVQLSLDIGFHKISFYFDSSFILNSFNNSGLLSVVFDIALFRVYDSEMLIIFEKESVFTSSEYYFSSFDPFEPLTLTTITDETTPITTIYPRDSTPTESRYLLFGIVLTLLLFTLMIKKKKLI